MHASTCAEVTACTWAVRIEDQRKEVMGETWHCQNCYHCFKYTGTSVQVKTCYFDNLVTINSIWGTSTKHAGNTTAWCMTQNTQAPAPKPASNKKKHKQQDEDFISSITNDLHPPHSITMLNQFYLKLNFIIIICITDSNHQNLISMFIQTQVTWEPSRNTLQLGLHISDFFT